MEVLLPKGTKEFLVVVVSDKLAIVTDLALTTVKYWVVREDGTEAISNATPTVTGMSAFCLIDTATFTEGAHSLFISIDVPPQKVVLGPFKFQVEDFEATV